MNRKIYIVDDDPSVRRALKRILKRLTTDIETFSSAEEFLESFITDRPACLILDIYLSGMTGIELYQHLIRSGQRIPVVFITAQDTESIREEAKKLSGISLLRKPFNKESLFVAIEKATAS